MEGSIVDAAVIHLGSKLIADGQTCIMISKVRSVDRQQIEDQDNTKLFGKKLCNNDALAVLHRMQNTQANQFRFFMFVLELNLMSIIINKIFNIKNNCFLYV